MNKFFKLFRWSFPKADRDIGEYSNKERNYYLIGMFGQNIIYGVIGAALSLFYTDILKISVGIVGIIVIVTNTWDALNDPIMGMIMDRTKSKWGKCRPYLKYAPVLVFFTSVLMFAPISGAAAWFKIFFAFLAYFLWSVAYTMGDIPLWSLTSLITEDEAKRSNLISLARVISSIGAVGVAIFPPLKDAFSRIDMGLFANTGRANEAAGTYFAEEQGYFFAILFITLIGTVLFKFVFVNVRERIDTSAQKKNTLKENLVLFKENKAFIQIISSGVLGSTRLLMMMTGLYFCKWVLGNGTEGMWIMLLGGVFIGGSMLSMALTPMFSRIFGKKRLYLITSYLTAVPNIILYFAARNSLDKIGTSLLPLLLALLLLSGFFTGFSGVLQTTMIADSVDYMEWKTGGRNDGIYFSGLSFVSKLTMGIATLLSTLLLGLVNYTPVIEEISKNVVQATESGLSYELNFSASYPDVAKMMFFLITIVPAIGSVLQCIPVHWYKLTEKRMEEIRAELSRNRVSAEKD